MGVGGGGFKAGSLDLILLMGGPDPDPDPDPSVGVARPSTGEVRSSSSQESITSSFFAFDFILDAEGRSMCRFAIFDSISSAGSAQFLCLFQSQICRTDRAGDPGDDNQERVNCTTSYIKVKKTARKSASQETESSGSHLVRCHRLGKALHRGSETSAIRLVVPPRCLPTQHAT